MAITRIGGEIQVNTRPVGGDHDIAAVAGGGFVAVFEDASHQSDDKWFGAVSFQLFSRNGSKIGVQELVNQPIDPAYPYYGAQNRAAAARSVDGGFLVLWRDEYQYSEQDTFGMGRFYSGAGLPRTDQFNTQPDFHFGTGTPSYASLEQSETSVATLEGGNFVMTWRSATDGDQNIWMQVLTTNGTGIGIPKLVNARVSAAGQWDPSVTALKGGGFVISWEDESSAATQGTNVRASVYNAAGGLVKGEFVVSVRKAGAQVDAKVAALTDGGFVAVWSEAGNVYARTFDSKGKPDGGDTLVNETPAYFYGPQPDVTGLPDGGFAVVWVNASTGTHDGVHDWEDIVLQLFDDQGEKRGVIEFQVNTATGFSHARPSVTLLDGGRLVVGWEAGGIHAQIFDIYSGVISGDAGANTLVGFDTNDDLEGLGGNDSIQGRGGKDLLAGDAGQDTLTGGQGRDIMSGGLAADIFDFNAANETGKGPLTRDQITDFRHLTDIIDLATIDANGTVAGQGTFTFLATKGAAFTGVRGELRWFQENPAGTANDKTIVEGDINGDQVADFQIELIELKNLTSADFVL